MAKPPAVISQLPAAIRARVEPAWQTKQFADAITQLEAARAKSPAAGEVAAALAATLFEDAVDAVIDLVPRCERALALLEEAERHGVAAATLRTLRGKIERVREGELARMRAQDAELEKLRKRRPDRLDYWKLMKLADATADVDPDRAIAYYELAEAAAKADVWRRDAVQGRAKCLARAGKWDAAIPMLEHAIAEVRDKVEGADYSFVDRACCLLLRHAAECGDRTLFRKRWQAAFEPDAPGVPLGRYFKVFPHARPLREPLLAAARKLGGLDDIVEHLEALIAKDSPRR
jgi:tetratricopeptide (TPR) repeat protein